MFEYKNYSYAIISGEDIRDINWERGEILIDGEDNWNIELSELVDGTRLLRYRPLIIYKNEYDDDLHDLHKPTEDAFVKRAFNIINSSIYRKRDFYRREIEWSNEMKFSKYKIIDYEYNLDYYKNEKSKVVLLSLQSNVKHTYYRLVINRPNHPIFNKIFCLDSDEVKSEYIVSYW